MGSGYFLDIDHHFAGVPHDFKGHERILFDNRRYGQHTLTINVDQGSLSIKLDGQVLERTIISLPQGLSYFGYFLPSNGELWNAPIPIKLPPHQSLGKNLNLQRETDLGPPGAPGKPTRD